MSTDLIARTNQALGCARYQVRLFEEARQNRGWSGAIAIQSHWEASVFHLRIALNSYYREVAERSNLPTDSIDSLQSLERLFDAGDKQSSEIEELRVLNESPQSWHTTLLSLFGRCWQSKPLHAISKPEDTHGSEIALTQLASGPADQELDLAKILQELSEFIARQRESMQEW